MKDFDYLTIRVSKEAVESRMRVSVSCLNNLPMPPQGDVLKWRDVTISYILDEATRAINEAFEAGREFERKNAPNPNLH